MGLQAPQIQKSNHTSATMRKAYYLRLNVPSYGPHHYIILEVASTTYADEVLYSDIMERPDKTYPKGMAILDTLGSALDLISKLKKQYRVRLGGIKCSFMAHPVYMI